MSNTPHHWDIIESKLHADCRVFNIEQQNCRHPANNKEANVFVINASNWVLTIPVTPDKKLVLVNQFRFGSKTLSWEFPGGCIEKGEDPVAGGIRELKEETGFTGENPQVIGHCSPNPAIMNNTSNIVLVENVMQTSPVNWDENEELETRIVEPEQVMKWIDDKSIHHTLSITAMMYYQLYLGNF